MPGAVNYLAHAWVLPPDAGPDVVLGAALPDLLRALEPSMGRRLPRLAADPIARLEAAGAAELAHGVRAHHAADASFHALPEFEAVEAELAPLVRDVCGATARAFFVGHVLVELLLDAELLAREPGLAGCLHDGLARADRGATASALARALPGWTDGTTRAFETGLDRFLEARFVLDYATDEGLARRLGQVAQRARQRLEAAGAARLLAGLPGARARVRRSLDALTLPPREAVRSLARPGERG